MKLLSSTLSSLIALGLTLPGCGSKAAAPAAPAGAVPFEKLSRQEKGRYMKEVVVPEMGKLFKAFDPVKYAEFGCKTCHGPGAAEGEFDMPNAGLTKLDFKNHDKMDAKAAEFMSKQVKPTMARLLGEPEYTPENPKGFGRLGCHTMVPENAAPAAAPAAGAAAPAPAAH